MKRSYGKKDANSDALDKYAVSCGVQLIKCSQYATLGFDRIYLFHGQVYLVEYKNPEQQWHLTRVEENRWLQAHTVGAKYNILETEIDICDMLGIEYVHQSILEENNEGEHNLWVGNFARKRKQSNKNRPQKSAARTARGTRSIRFSRR